MKKFVKVVLVVYLFITGITMPYLIYKIYEINIQDDYLFRQNPIEVGKLFKLSSNYKGVNKQGMGKLFLDTAKEWYETTTIPLKETRYEYRLLGKTNSYSIDIDVFFFCENQQLCVALYYEEQNRLILYRTENSHTYSRTTYLKFNVEDSLPKDLLLKEIRSSEEKVRSYRVFYIKY